MLLLRKILFYAMKFPFVFRWLTYCIRAAIIAGHPLMLGSFNTSQNIAIATPTSCKYSKYLPKCHSRGGIHLPNDASLEIIVVVVFQLVGSCLLLVSKSTMVHGTPLIFSVVAPICSGVCTLKMRLHLTKSSKFTVNRVWETGTTAKCIVVKVFMLKFFKILAYQQGLG